MCVEPYEEKCEVERADAITFNYERRHSPTSKELWSREVEGAGAAAFRYGIERFEERKERANLDGVNVVPSFSETRRRH